MSNTTVVKFTNSRSSFSIQNFIFMNQLYIVVNMFILESKHLHIS